MTSFQTSNMENEESHIEFGYLSQLSLFQPSIIDTGVERFRCVPTRPVSQMDNSLEFVVKNSSSAYIDFARTTLQLKVQVLMSDGSPIPAVSDLGDMEPASSKLIKCEHNLYRVSLILTRCR